MSWGLSLAVAGGVLLIVIVIRSLRRTKALEETPTAANNWQNERYARSKNGNPSSNEGPGTTYETPLGTAD
jgi:hypothetical protein